MAARPPLPRRANAPIRKSKVAPNTVKADTGRVSSFVRARLGPLLALLAVALLIYQSVNRPAAHERLYLADNIELPSPPPLPASGLAALQLGMQRLSQERQLAQQNPDDANLQYAVGVASLRFGDPLTALPALRRGIPPKPGADLIDQLGKALNKLGMCLQALAQYQQMVRAYPLDARGYLEEAKTLDLLNRRVESARALEDGLAALQPDDVPGRVSLVSQFDADGATSRGLAEVQALHRRLPDNSQAVLWVVNFLIRSQRPAEADALLSNLLVREPKNAQAHFAMGVVLSNPLLPERDMRAAESELLLAVRLAPQEPSYYGRLSAFYLDQGRYRQCAYVSLQELAFRPDSGVARLNLASSYAHLGLLADASRQGEIASSLFARDQAKANLQTQISENATSPMAYLALARHYKRYAEYANALPQYEAAYVHAPTDAHIRNELADLCDRIGIALPDLPAPEDK